MKALIKCISKLREPYLNNINRLLNLYYRIKTVVFYKPCFRFIGINSVIRNPLLLLNTQYISIGNNVHIRDHSRLEVIINGNDVQPRLIVGDNTNIEQNVHMVCHDTVIIGANVSITANCAIVDVTHPYDAPGDDRKIGDRILNEPSEVIIGDGTFIGIGSVILPNVRIGTNVVIGANSVVTKDIPDSCIAAGNPAEIIKKYNKDTNVWERVRR